jgi:hypothetical protein
MTQPNRPGVTHRATRLRKAMRVRFMSAARAPSYTWCRDFVLRTGWLAWSNWVHLEAIATGDWRSELASNGRPGVTWGEGC